MEPLGAYFFQFSKCELEDLIEKGVAIKSYCSLKALQGYSSLELHKETFYLNNILALYLKVMFLENFGKILPLLK